MPGKEAERYWKILGLSFLIFAAEVCGGIFSGSLALLSDAGHVFADKIAILISIAVAYLVNRKKFSENQIRGWGAKINAILLGAIAIWIFWEAWQRIRQPKEILTGIMFWVALLGAILNYFQHQVLESAEEQERHLTHKAMDIHILSDLGQSLAVVIASILIKFTSWLIVDPVLSMAVAAVMIYWSLKLFRSK